MLFANKRDNLSRKLGGKMLHRVRISKFLLCLKDHQQQDLPLGINYRTEDHT